MAIALASGRKHLGVGAPGAWIGKQPLRKIYAAAHLPAFIQSRTKTPLNEGAGFDQSQSNAPWMRFAEELLSDADLKDGAAEFADFAVTTKEELCYICALAAQMDVHRVPHLRDRAFIRLPAAAAIDHVAAFAGSRRPV